MQSFLQYRSFKTSVKDQYERDRKKAEALQDGHRGERRTDLNEDSPPVDSGLPHFPSDSRDPEKGEHAPAAATQQHTSTGTGHEKVDNHTEPGEHGHGPKRSPSNNTLQPSQTFGTSMGTVLTGIEVRQITHQMSHRSGGKTTTCGGPQENSAGSHGKDKFFVVNYESEADPMNPHNWNYRRRISATLLIAAVGFIVGFASSIDSSALREAAKDFGVGEVVESLATGIFLVGFGCGALFAGPISETVGRNPVYIVTLGIYICWLVGAALAPNIGAQLVFRFLAGFFGSTPLTCAGGSISDLWDPMERVYAFPVFANAAFMGPIFGPVCGGFIAQSKVISWRWTEWTTIIGSGLVLGLVVLFQPETYTPTLLKWKAKHLRELTGDERYVAEIEIKAETLGKRILHALYRPFVITSREPIVVLFALYLAVIYIILFTFLDGYAYIFGATYGFSAGITGLVFLGIGLGLCGASLLVPLIHHAAKAQLAAVQAKAGPSQRLPPEFRLWFAMGGAPAVPVSLFWMGWTDERAVSYWSPLLASVLFGYGILCIFISTYQYIIDSYELYAASALASLTFIRYVAAGGMVEVGIPFYKNLGVHWTLTILGAISAVLVPVPYLFYFYGPKIRSYSSYAQT